jgi:hypothetical protein
VICKGFKVKERLAELQDQYRFVRSLVVKDDRSPEEINNDDKQIAPILHALRLEPLTKDTDLKLEDKSKVKYEPTYFSLAKIRDFIKGTRDHYTRDFKSTEMHKSPLSNIDLGLKILSYVEPTTAPAAQCQITQSRLKDIAVANQARVMPKKEELQIVPAAKRKKKKKSGK